MMAELNIEAECLNAVRDGIRKGVADKLTGYNSPLDKLLAAALDAQSSALRSLMDSAIQSALADTTFRENIAQAVRTKLASTLVQRFGGELEKQVNALKSDPSTRARITVAIDDIIKTAAPKAA